MDIWSTSSEALICAVSLKYNAIKQGGLKVDNFTMKEIEESLILKVERNLELVKNCLSNSLLSNISYSIEARTQGWYKEYLTSFKKTLSLGYI